MSLAARIMIKTEKKYQIDEKREITLLNSKAKPGAYLTGFTLIEVLVAAAILSGALIFLSYLQTNLFKQNIYLGKSLEAESDARSALKRAIASLRTMAPSNTGEYPIISANKNEIIFFSDTNSDGVREMIRYFIENGDLKRGVTTPSGIPYVYATSSEQVTLDVRNVKNSDTGIFSYYNEQYAGTSTPLTFPVNIPDIRLIRVSIQIDADPNRSPIPMTFTSEVTPRNLKDNL